MPRGRVIHQEIQDGLGEINQEHRRLSQLIDEETERIADLVNGREGAYGSLAALYLPELSGQEMLKSLQKVQQTVQDCFRRKQQKRSELEIELSAKLTERKAVMERVLDATETLEARHQAVLSAETDLKKRFEADEEWKRLNGFCQASMRRISIFQERAKTFAEEARAKLGAYESEPLFKYLQKAGMGAPEYSPNPVIRYLDDWVGTLVGYKEAKKNYDRLSALPQFIQNEIAVQENELAGLQSSVTEVQALHAAEVGLPELQKLAEKAQAAKDELDRQIAQIDETSAKLSEALKNLDSTKDTFHRDALKKLKEFLKGETLSELRQRAKETPHPDDDTLVRELERIEDEIKEAQDRITSYKGDQVALRDRQAELTRVERWFTRNSFNGSRSQFSDNIDIGSLMGGFIAGQLTEAALRHTLQSEQSFASPSHFDPSSHSSHSSSDFGSSSSSSPASSDSGGGWSTTDSSSSAGFSSTDSF